ncbi:arylesterase [Sulfitobacter sp. M57]|uniref:arylesterase n=1 Tax=unclassified Sulfitobacter TaxID=196795 RepID=UPI0023E2AAB0|nr:MULTISPECIES: arylesterase [unclassified Sulfitobacter]MDF3414515.1 arylesterase [Sulfitobacter sp. KE5]MDF3421996.1 arylesterase [Sulfitobacter sp. KE43]MDF3433061.1 arylesterase [Sulfitobacter sp. KE42]MDF3458701.1 arylesterase [Sulfitobacter sp. S74]MDF3462601.1 arylesterase [Sulfitobacter sp. Ks18]
MRKALAGIVFILAGLAQAGVARAEQVVIAALGDSLTQGYGLPAAQGFVPQLQAWLDAQGADVRLINAGVSGDTTAGGLSRVAWTLTPEVDGMIVALGGNDLLRGLAPEQARSNIDGILQAADTAKVEVLLIGMAAPGNFGPAYKSQFDAIYPELAAHYGSGYLESFFAGLSAVGDISNPLTLKDYFQADGVHPNAEGVALIVTQVGPKVLALIDEITG